MILLIVLGIRVARRFYKYYFQYTSYSNNNQQQCYRIEFYPRARRTSGEEILREHRVILGTSASTLPRPVPPPHDCKRVGESYGTRQTAYRKPVFSAVSGFTEWLSRHTFGDIRCRVDCSIKHGSP